MTSRISQASTKISKPEKVEVNKKPVEVSKKPVESPQLAKEHKIPTKEASTVNSKQTPLKVEEKPIETPEYTLSPDRKILQIAKDVEIIHVPFGGEVIYF